MHLCFPLSFTGCVRQYLSELCQIDFIFQYKQKVWIKELTDWLTHWSKPVMWDVYARLWMKALSPTSMWQHMWWKSVTEREAVIYVRGLIAEGSVCWRDYHGEALSMHGRLTKFSLWWRSAPQSPKYPDEKVTGRSGNGSILTGGEMGWPIPQGDLISFNVSLRTRSAVRLWMKL